MKVMLVTGYIDYETFGDHSNTAPIAKGSVYDASTPELDKAAKIKALLNDFKEYFEDYEHYFQSNIVKPKEPTFTISELKDSAKVEKRVATYERESKEYHDKMESAAIKDALINDLISLAPENINTYAESVNVETLDALFKQVSNAATDEAVERVYYFEVQ